MKSRSAWAPGRGVERKRKRVLHAERRGRQRGNVTDGSALHDDVDRALGSCGSTAWTPAVVRMFDVDAMCWGADDQVIIVCRAVQRLIRMTLYSPTGV